MSQKQTNVRMNRGPAKLITKITCWQCHLHGSLTVDYTKMEYSKPTITITEGWHICHIGDTMLHCCPKCSQVNLGNQR